jgi:hypothetical protein
MSLTEQDVADLRSCIRAAAIKTEMIETALAGLSDEQVAAIPRLVAWYRNWFWQTDWNTAEAQAEYVALGRIFSKGPGS